MKDPDHLYIVGLLLLVVINQQVILINTDVSATQLGPYPYVGLPLFILGFISTFVFFALSIFKKRKEGNGKKD